MADDPNKPSHENLADDIDRLQRKTDAAANAGKAGTGKSSFIESLAPQIQNWWHRLTARFAIFATLRDILAPFGRLIRWVFNLLRGWFRWAAFKPQNPSTELANSAATFSPRRFALVSIGTIVGLFILHAALSAAYFYSTRFNETVYVTGKQEIETGEKYQFGGCTSLPCSTETDNGKFYLIETSLYFPRLFYPEENVFANIPQQNAACRVEGYGIYFRQLRWLYKSAQLYQHVFNVSCRPFTDQELERTMSDGKVQG